ncbi:hypothetical protein RJ641_016735 [Dillenia turbinata]|uniref:AB hydrolase-1 domain-containing protein n=1 Tax=Dillenia turbinata TaxID=194707 RepID=A0AAN8UYZ1_9MAGN
MGETKSPAEHDSGGWYSVPDLRLRDHRFTVPLDYSRDASPKINVFAREVIAVGKEDKKMPYLLYLEGGPGFESPRPTDAGGWINKACEEYRRGTGLSTPLTASSMLQLKSAKDLAKYLKHFRADNIVRLVPDAEPWTILGQSFGGFCGVTYLSFAPKGLKQVLLTGGIPRIEKGCTADAVYKACFQQVICQNEKYYERFRQDIELIREVVQHLAESEGGGVSNSAILFYFMHMVRLPSGGMLTPRLLQIIGLSGLGSSTGFERMHYILTTGCILIPILSLHFCMNLYIARAEYDGKFDAIRAAKEGCHIFFTGGMIFPWMFDEVHALRNFKEAAHLLAEKTDWPPLYDVATLRNNKIPIAAAVYYEDPYVNFKLAIGTASQIAGIRLWVTNEYMHSGLVDGGGQVFEHLLGLLNGKKPSF